MVDDRDMTDEALLAELGERLARHRLNADRTQADLAREAGVSKRTVKRIEAGESVQLTSWLRVLRALGLLSNLEHLIPARGVRPLEELRRERGQRRRASGKRAATRAEPWSWEEEPRSADGGPE